MRITLTQCTTARIYHTSHSEPYQMHTFNLMEEFKRAQQYFIDTCVLHEHVLLISFEFFSP